MKTLALVATAASLMASAALAETVVIKKEGIGGSTTVVREVGSPAVVERREVTSTGTVGCDTTSVTKTNDLGETTTKTKTEC